MGERDGGIGLGGIDGVSATARRKAVADTIPGGQGSQVEKNAAAGASVSEAVTQRARAASYRIESFDIKRSACDHRTIVVLPVSDRLQVKGGQHGIQ